MKSHPSILRAIVIEARQRGKTYREIAHELRLPEATLRSWNKRHATSHATATSEGKEDGHATSHATDKGQWMQSLHHDSAHFLINGEAACAAAANGVHQLPGVVWFPHDGCVRKCMRCMRHQ